MTSNFLSLPLLLPLAIFCAFKWEQYIISSWYGRLRSASLYEHFTVTKDEYCLTRYATNTYRDNDIVTTASNETRGQVHENYVVPGYHININLCVIGGGNTRHQQFGWTQCLPSSGFFIMNKVPQTKGSLYQIGTNIHWPKIIKISDSQAHIQKHMTNCH